MIISIDMEVVRERWSDQPRIALYHWYVDQIMVNNGGPMVGCATSLTLASEGEIAVTCPCTGLAIFKVASPPPLDLQAEGVTIQHGRRS